MDIMRRGKNPNFLGSWDLDDVQGRKLTLTIKSIADEEVITNGQKEEATVCHWEEDYKPMILNLTNKKRLAKLYHTKLSENLVGKRVTITTEVVKAFGGTYDALRFVQIVPPAVSDKVIPCEMCGEKIMPVGKMTADAMAAYTKKKYGSCLCSKCATQLAQEREAKQ